MDPVHATEKSEILVLTTGGTIDKSYFDALSRFCFEESIIGHLLETARVTRPLRLKELMRKDSLELDENDRSIIASAVRDSAASRIVITHGTDTVARTARELYSLGLDKVIVLVGAFTPARFAASDAAFNLGMAFAAVQLAPRGVYITMNGSVFDACQAVKDRERGTFLVGR